jgi:hypothetical protein
VRNSGPTRRVALLAGTALSAVMLCSTAGAAQFFFSTGNPDGKIAFGSRPASTGTSEIETADDLVVTDATGLGGATFTGLIPMGASLAAIQQVDVEIYRVFPTDSDVTRTSGPPTASTPQVPTRVNSPSDIDAGVRSNAGGGLSFVASVLSASFTANNSVLNGIHPKPNQLTGGDGPVAGVEVAFNVRFDAPILLSPGHYFFVPQVRLSSGDFLWLSAPMPIVAPGTPFAPDLQTWTRNAALAPDWLRVGTDIVGVAPQFNGAFAVSGEICAPITVSPASLPSATIGSAYAASFTASGGVPPYRFTANGALPSGLTLDPAGSLAGTPAQAGPFPFAVAVADAGGCTGSGDVTLTVAAAAPGGPTTSPISPVTPPLGPAKPPSITSARLSGTAFRAAGHGASLARRRPAPIGTTVSYRDAQPATTTFTVLKPVSGRKSGSRCLARRPRKHQTRCTRYVSLGSASHRDAAGSVRVRFSGRIRGHRLSPGRYLLTLTPRADGQTGRTVRLAFRIVA